MVISVLIYYLKLIAAASVSIDSDKVDIFYVTDRKAGFWFASFV